MLVLDVVLGQSSEVPFDILLASEISPGVFAFVLPSQAGKHTLWACRTPTFAVSLGIVMVPLLLNGFVVNGL